MMATGIPAEVGRLCRRPQRGGVAVQRSRRISRALVAASARLAALSLR